MSPIFGVVVAVLALGVITGTIAKSKGHSFFGWFIFGAAIFIVALPMAILIKPAVAGGTRPCPHCLARIPLSATVCSHCTRDVPLGTRTMQCPVCKAQNAIGADLSSTWTCSTCGRSWALRKTD